MQIIVTSDTNGTELYHLSILFQSLAKAHGFVAPVDLENVTSITLDPTQEQVEALREMCKDGIRGGALVAIREPGVVHSVDVVGTIEPPVIVTVDEPVRAPADMTDAEHFQSCVDAGTVEFVALPTTDTNLDVNGLPWDARIHAGSRERNTDGSWRVRRRPKGVEEADWDATLARVTAELTDLMAIPVSPGAVADAAAEEAQVLTDAEVDTFVDIVQGVTGEIDQHGELVSVETVFVAPPVTIAPPVVVPPVTAVAPPITVDKPAIETFAQLMSWLTSRTPKDEAAKPAMVTRVNEILAANGLTTLQQLGQRSELIPQVLVQFQAAFGE
jgi:hypothetical protein